MMNEINKERRGFSRSPFTSPVTLQIASPSSGEDPWLHGVTENVSENGVCLVAESALERSCVLRLRLPLPGVSATVPTLAEVRWVKRTPGEESCTAGLRFLL